MQQSQNLRQLKRRRLEYKAKCGHRRSHSLCFVYCMIYCQGDIVKFSYDPTLGHEQSGFLPAVVISRRMFQEKTGQVIVCPITSRSPPYPTRVLIGDSNETTGFIICDHVKTIDVIARNPIFVERLIEEDLDKVLAIVHSLTEKDTNIPAL